MDINAKVQRVNALMRRLHALQKQQDKVLAELCELGTGIVQQQGPGLGVTAETTSEVIEPKEEDTEQGG